MMMQTFVPRQLLLFAGLIFPLVASAGADSMRDVPRQTSLRVGHIQHAAELPVYVALEEGYFRDEGIDVHLFTLGYREVMDALLRESIDVVPVNSLIASLNIEAESPGTVKIFNLGGISASDTNLVEAVIARQDSAVKSLYDLKGKRVGVPIGAVDKFVLTLILRHNGLDPERGELSILELGENALLAAFVSGHVDALYLTQPRLASVLARTEAETIARNPRAELITPFWTGAGVVTANFVKDNCELVLKLMRAIDRGIDQARRDPAAAKQLLVKYAAASEDVLSEVGLYFRKMSSESVDLDSLQE